MTNYITFKQTTHPLQKLTIRPNANGDTIQLTTECAQNWQCVDEVSHDGFTTINYAGSLGEKYDLYELTDHTTEDEAIVQVNVFAYVNPIHVKTSKAKTVIKTYGAEFVGESVLENQDEWRCVGGYYNVNPYTDKKWTWTEIDDLQAGVKLYTLASINCVTQVYVDIYYYATVESCCTLIVPEKISTDHAQNVREMNMWNGERIVFGDSRSKWSLLLKGQDWESIACDRIECIKQQGLDGIPITIEGLNNENWDGEWIIKSFGWKLAFETPIHYKWMILLERT